MAVVIEDQPGTDELKAAYRPVLIRGSVVNPIPPIVYCDIYFNDVYYRTSSMTRYSNLVTGGSEWEFDIQDAAQKYLATYIANNAEQQITEATPILVKVFCRLRSSSVDSDGFTVPEPTAPIQGTLNEDPIAGTGTQTNTFYILNATLQHEDHQTLPNHLNSFKNRTWEALTYPVTHRPDRYKICVADSDSFPIITNRIPSGLVLHYLPAGGTIWQSTAGACVPVQIISSEVFPDADEGVAYSFAMTLAGTAPFSISGIPTKPDWMTIAIVGNEIQFTGTPDAGDVGNDFSINLTISNCGGGFTRDIEGFIDVIAAVACVPVSFTSSTAIPDAQESIPYVFSISLGGTAPFTLSAVVKPAWMTIAIVGSAVQFSGTPATADVAEGVVVQFTVENCATDEVNLDEMIDVNPIGLGNALEVKASTSQLTICSSPSFVAYTSTGNLAPGNVVYVDSALTIPLTGYNFILKVGPGQIFTISPSTGTVITLTGDTC